MNKHLTSLPNKKAGCCKYEKKHIFVVLLIASILAGYYYMVRYRGLAFACTFNAMFGLECPGCGATRMLLSVARLEFYQAFRYNMLAFVFLPMAAYVIFRGVYDYIRGMSLADTYIIKWIVCYYKIIIILLFAWTVIRNLIPVLGPVEV